MTKYRIDRSSDDLWAVFTELQGAARQHFAAVYKRKLITYAAELVDGASVKNRFGRLLEGRNVAQLDSMFPIHVARLMLDEAHQHVRKTRERLPELDIEFELTLMVDVAEDRIYMSPFYEGGTYDEVVETFPDMTEVEDHKFNNHVKRLGGQAPAQVGLSWELIGFYPPSFHVVPLFSELLAAQPTPEERREAIIKRLAVKKNRRGYDPDTQRLDMEELAEGLREARAEIELSVQLPEPLTEKDLGEWA